MNHSHSHAAHGAGDHEHGHGHGGLGKYVMVFLALCVLTAISFAVGNSTAMRQTPAVMWAMMMAVSCVKALLVILFFMHLLWEANWKYVLTIPASIMSLFLVLMLVPDIGRRTRNYSEERWLYAPEPHVHEAEHGHQPAADGHAGEQPHPAPGH